MLTLINLYVIDKIFNEKTEVKLSGTARALYVNCLTHYFRDKKPTVANAVQFQLFINDIPNYEKLERVFQELHRAELIEIGLKSVIFYNMWGQLIDRDKLDKVSPQNFVAGFKFQKVKELESELLNSSKLFELAMRKHKMSKEQTIKLIELFIAEQDTFETTYSNFSECIKHCTYWIQRNSDKIPKQTVVSTSKILGG